MLFGEIIAVYFEHHMEEILKYTPWQKFRELFPADCLVPHLLTCDFRHVKHWEAKHLRLFAELSSVYPDHTAVYTDESFVFLSSECAFV
jgi:hypothetical protein